MEGTVIKSTGSWYYVRNEEGRIIPCRIRGKLRMKGIRATNPVVVGDQVIFSSGGDGSSGLITEIKERRNYIMRKASKLSSEYQLLASNVDIIWLMVSMVSPRTYTEFIDRILVAAESFRIPVTILFNKTDICSPQDLGNMEELIRIYSSIGYPCIKMSVIRGEGIETVRERMAGKTNVVTGNSGVGKSALINALEPSLKLKVGEISDSHKAGKHTTTYAEMAELSNGGKIIDTPGIKGFGMIDIEKEELFHFFPEIFRISKDCQFHNCLHYREPNCAVREAVGNNLISASRYNNYINMLMDNEGKYR
ncbi:MAG: ribosome small subunit-dependent GTPase A [Bacteroidales bacterium]|nr:ribosome small subunit-dependent GTPase A [Bacteroidales bacterium]MBN2697821.1 ribosome small subunit-dependent GTPase A [Bacteroidales bacterium]